jgi:hypothetical protein
MELGMTGSISRRLAKLATALLLTTGAIAITASAAGAAVVFNNTPKPIPGNVPSLGFASDSTTQFGGQVEFLNGKSVTPSKISVLMSSWACGNLKGGSECKTTRGQTFPYKITLNIYNVGTENEPGTLIATETPTINVPYRPSAAKHCPATSEGGVGWGKECLNGKAFEANFPAAELVWTNPAIKRLPATAIISVGYEPYSEENQGQDSLNVGLTEVANSQPSVGESPLLKTEEVYLKSTYCVLYEPKPCTKEFTLAGEWGTYQPVFEVKGISNT